MDKGELCAGCKSTVTDLQYMKCNTCKLKFDIICAGVSESSFKRLTKTQKNSWICTICRSKVPKSDNTNTPVRQAPAPDVRATSMSNESAGTGKTLFHRCHAENY